MSVLNRFEKWLFIVTGIIVLCFAIIFSGFYIYYWFHFNKQNVATPVEGKIIFNAMYRDMSKTAFIIDDGKITPIGNGLRIFFSDYKKTLGYGDNTFFITDLNDKNLKEIKIPTLYAPLYFDISPDGNTIAFTSFMNKVGHPWNIYTIDIDGKNLKQLTDFPAKGFWKVGAPKISPDSKKVLFSAPKTYKGDTDTPGIWVVNTDGSGLIELTKDAHWGGAYPAWSHDGKHVVFSSYEANDKPIIYNLYVMDSDGSNIKRITNFKWDAIDPVYSPDDKQICFVGKQRGDPAGSELFAVNADGSHFIRLTPAKRVSRYPGWATDEHPDWGR